MREGSRRFSCAADSLPGALTRPPPAVVSRTRSFQGHERSPPLRGGKPMLSPGQHLISLFRAVTPAAVITFLVTLVALPGAAQNSVPPTAVQAAKMPQFAKRLAHPASTPNPAPAHQASR